MSGMELLLRAAELGGAASAGPPSCSHQSLPPKKRTKLARGDSGLGHTDAPTVNSERTNTEARAARPEGVGGRAEIVSVPGESVQVSQPAWIGPDEWQNILVEAKNKANHVVTFTTGSNEANCKSNPVGKSKEGRSKSNASKSKGRGRKRKVAPLVKDVDGNDIGMGYFSANPPRNAVSPAASPVASPPAATEPTAPVSLPPLNLRDANVEEPTVNTTKAVPLPVKEMLYRAYLAGLHRPRADR